MLILLLTIVSLGFASGAVAAEQEEERKKTIFWSSETDRKINPTPINGKPEKFNSILNDPSSWIHGLAVDWIYDHLYWLDFNRPQLVVSNFNGSMNKVLFSDYFSVSCSIAVNPLNGWMYWTDQWRQGIERAGLDGSRREVILRNVHEPHSLVVNLDDNRLYWSQGVNPSSIWSCKLDGSDQKLIFSPNPSQFYSSVFSKIATLDNYVYFIDWFSGRIFKVNKYSEEELDIIYKSDFFLNEINIYDATLQPEGQHLCSKRIDRCSHFCFLVPSSWKGSVAKTTCACPDGRRLSTDQQNCI